MVEQPSNCDPLRLSPRPEDLFFPIEERRVLLGQEMIALLVASKTLFYQNMLHYEQKCGLGKRLQFPGEILSPYNVLHYEYLEDSLVSC
jgi:hypothetical protein